MRRRFAVQDSLFPDLSVEREHFGSSGVTFDFRDFSAVRTDPEQFDEIDGIVLGTMPFGSAYIDKLPSTVKVIGRAGVGLDNLDLAHTASRRIGILNCPDYCNEEVASHALALILAMIRRLPQSDPISRSKWSEWELVGDIAPISDQTVGILGYGRTGSLLARWLEPFVGRVIVHDPYVSGVDIGTSVDLGELLQNSDVLSIHVPLNDETRHLIGSTELALMKRTASVVNISRGGIVDEHALGQALFAGTIAGAALDVLETEPPEPDSPLLSAPNLMLTPHTAWYSTRSEVRLRVDIVAAMLDYLDGKSVTTANIAVDGRTISSSENAKRVLQSSNRESRYTLM
ncbi:C-terminal binding protein [Rhodococcus sp. NPDC059968]|uniref:C-terminal binding protein n=1 Tax=Rhodococcus sp. NPDC059968 TaxID=3347017 RepID=UPI0036720053